ncbi:hypothetical protein BACCAC_01131 [Bacteroides caccae ATCC 43185]|nr:hypothetical protein BACCAC_01131 [Bacteroides caccae ATCC 43185]
MKTFMLIGDIPVWEDEGKNFIFRGLEVSEISLPVTFLTSNIKFFR